MTATPENAPCWHNQYRPREIFQYPESLFRGLTKYSGGGGGAEYYLLHPRIISLPSLFYSGRKKIFRPPQNIFTL